jgi:hypothetical protein
MRTPHNKLFSLCGYRSISAEMVSRRFRVFARTSLGVGECTSKDVMGAKSLCARLCVKQYIGVA